MRNEQTAPETKGVTVTLLSALDLGPEIEGMAGRQFRIRMVTFLFKNKGTTPAVEISADLIRA